ncbi:nuclease-related domain-containing protein [Edaphobacillus lindanitolerans]|uniref:Nuclease-related domain-containing protein n=1 Tax=Edaphobacillus lindanitolerans TaxID=550447 RepID=A0A1U7PLI3_9BACI|nr:nuclease-related domain-containing protein [Edaphobacillus lindanitolerans]SIT74130.1 Nuclease-related domain-containing protein [Edaphobacillus lindanitolerans]
MGERRYPLELRKLEATLGRMWPNDPRREEIEAKKYRAEAGYKGEVMVDRHLRGLRLPGSWSILRDIRLQIHRDYIAQFDTLLVSDRGIWIIESKMIRGRLQWHENPRRLERIDEDGTVLSMSCPITQLDNQKSALTGWLSERGIHMTVSGAVVFTLQNVWSGLPGDAPLISVKEIQSYLTREVGLAQRIAGNVSPEQVAQTILANQIRLDSTPAAELFNLRPEGLKAGLLCESCFGKLTRITQRTFVCGSCNEPVGGNPYERALLDYVLVFKSTFTNREFCEFAEISSPATGQRQLDQYHFHITGNTNRLRYRFIPEIHLDGTGKQLRKR